LRASAVKTSGTHEMPNQAAPATWVEVCIPALCQNFRIVQKHVGQSVTVCAVVKADAYGHGAVECSLALQKQGVRWLGVTALEEAIILREAGIETRILLMTGFWHGEESEIVRLQLTPVTWESWQIQELEKAVADAGACSYPVHLKVDTGMGRLGVTLDGLPGVLAALKSSSHLRLEGLSTHLAESEVLDAPSVSEQERRFTHALSLIRGAGFDPPFIHMANTSAILSRRQTWNTMVRPGLSLYGYHLPFTRLGREVSGDMLQLPLKPVLTWKTRIFGLRDFSVNTPLGYGGTYVTRAQTRVAVLPVGYADGFNRQLSNRGRVLVRGHYAPVVGGVSMNLTLVDVTRIADVAVGDEVILLGSYCGLAVDALEHARLTGGLLYEILCNIPKHVPRRYVNSVRDSSETPLKSGFQIMKRSRNQAAASIMP
jgi:alanine racemase